MLKAGPLGLLVIICDVLAVVLGLLSAHALWVSYKPHLELVLHISWWELWLPNPFMPSGIVLLLTWLLVLRQLGLYEPSRFASSARIAAGVTRASAVVVLVVVILQFMLPDRTYSRFLILSVCGLTSMLVGTSRLLLFQFQSRVRPHTQRRRVAIVGVGQDAAAMSTRLERYGHRTYAIAGFVRPQESREAQVVEESAVLGQTSEFQSLVNEHNLQVLVIATHDTHREEALQLARRADQMELRVLQVPFTWGIANPRIDLTNLGDLQLIDLATLAYPTLAEQIKRILDLILTLLGGLVILPPLLVIALAIKLQDGGPVFFIQGRSGRGGRKFPFFKFRSMVTNAEALRGELQSQNESDGVLFKMKDDPRITPFGHFIRKYSLDEFPQLINVIRGDMNLVGPRPLPMKDLEGIAGDPEAEYWFEMRSKVNPGMTGMWQVAGRSDLGFKEMIQHDIDYIQNWSLWLDIVILLKTIPAVLKGRGAS